MSELTESTAVALPTSYSKMSIKQLFSDVDIKKKFQEMLGGKAQGFCASVLQIAASNDYLQKADPISVYNAALLAATLDLPINPNLGFAAIVPYGNKATFQMMYKGFIQLALRSGQFLTINVTDVKDGEIKGFNRLTGEIEFEWYQGSDRLAKATLGHVAYFRLLNGFQKSLYMSVDDIRAHGKKYSQMYKRNSGLWVTDFDMMAQKTVVKLLLSRFAPLSIEMQKAILADQAIVANGETGETYPDNEEIPVDKESERVGLMIDQAETIQELEEVRPFLKDEHQEGFKKKMEIVTARKVEAIKEKDQAKKRASDKPVDVANPLGV